MITPHQLAKDFSRTSKVVWLTGAGLSAAAGISPFRATNDAVWERFATEWGTVKKLRENPQLWKAEFWHKILPANMSEIAPTNGHRAIDFFVKSYQHTVITQNIDTLHEKAGTSGDALIEVHGRYDKFVCLARNCTNDVQSHDGQCWACKGILRPLVLLFDESYNSHPAYKYDLAEDRLRDADIIVFVGTSLSVGITTMAQFYGSRSGRRMINLNLSAEPGFENLVGPCEDTLSSAAASIR